jgi:amidase
MPIGLTIAGRAYDDVRLLRAAAAMEREGVTERHAPPRTPPLQGEGQD